MTFFQFWTSASKAQCQALLQQSSMNAYKNLQFPAKFISHVLHTMYIQNAEYIHTTSQIKPWKLEHLWQYLYLVLYAMIVSIQYICVILWFLKLIEKYIYIHILDHSDSHVYLYNS